MTKCEKKILDGTEKGWMLPGNVCKALGVVGRVGNWEEVCSMCNPGVEFLVAELFVTFSATCVTRFK